MKKKGIPKGAHMQAKANLQKAIKLLQAVVRHEKSGIMAMKGKKR